jgi:phage tail-like protein
MVEIVDGTPGVRRVAPVTAWGTATHAGTEIEPATGEVRLARLPAAERPWPTGGPPAGRAALGFDRDGCLYHGDPARGQVSRIPWPERGEPVDLLPGPTVEPDPDPGGFVPAADPRRPLRAWAVAADADEHLFVLDGASGTVALLDLLDGHLLRTVTLDAPPVDLVATPGGGVIAAVADRTAPLVALDAVGAPQPVPLDAEAVALLGAVPAVARPARLAAAGQMLWLLLRAGDDGWVVPVRGARLAMPLRVPGATGLAGTALARGGSRLVVAGPPGTDLRVWTVTGRAAEPDPPLRARGHDGTGIVATPDGRIGFWTGTAFRIAVAERPRYVPEGVVDTVALDSRAFGQRWGRVFVEACVPPGTTLTVAFSTADEVDELSPLPGRTTALHRRETGTEQPWLPPARTDRYETYEAPVTALPGRHLRVRLRLAGPGSSTPRVRALRAEFPSHDLVERLPRAFRRDPAAAAFLRRYLAIVDGQLGDLELRAARRDLLLDPHGAPAEVLDWLASLVGLVLDARWPEATRRTVLAEAGDQFRRRGTLGGLTRLLEIYLGTPVVVLEAFRLRGPPRRAVGGAGEESGPDAAIVGVGLRLGGDAPAGAATPYTEHAHRFTVLVPRDLDDEEHAVVADLLDMHRPAHTSVEVCALGRGMRVGASLHVGISTVVGPGSGFTPARVGRDRLGRGTLVGRGRAGLRPGAARVGPGTVVDG